MTDPNTPRGRVAPALGTGHPRAPTQRDLLAEFANDPSNRESARIQEGGDTDRDAHNNPSSKLVFRHRATDEAPERDRRGHTDP
jgi:hypothetical protein